MNLWEYRNIIAFATIPTLCILFYGALRLQRWKTSEEIHMSGFDKVYLEAKFFIYGIIVSSISAAIYIYTGW